MCHTGRVSAPRDAAPNARLVLGSVAVLVVFTQIGRALLPTLITEAPLLLVLMSPAPGHLILAAAVTSFAPFVMVATFRRMLATACGYYLGVLYGEQSVTWVEEKSGIGGRVLRVLLSIFKRYPYPMTFLWPTGTSMMAGMAGLPKRLYLPVATAGQVLWSAVFYYAGESLKPWIDPILVFVRVHMFELTAATIAVVIAWQLIRRRRGKPGPAGLDLPS